MQARRFSAAQSSHLLPRAERGEQPSGVLGRAHGIRAQAFDRWRQQCSGMRVRAAQRWRALSHENARLKRRCAERDLEVDGLQAGLAKQS
jgi:Transposase